MTFPWKDPTPGRPGDVIGIEKLWTGDTAAASERGFTDIYRTLLPKSIPVIQPEYKIRQRRTVLLSQAVQTWGCRCLRDEALAETRAWRHCYYVTSIVARGEPRHETELAEGCFARGTAGASVGGGEGGATTHVITLTRSPGDVTRAGPPSRRERTLGGISGTVVTFARVRRQPSQNPR